MDNFIYGLQWGIGFFTAIPATIIAGIGVVVVLLFASAMVAGAIDGFCKWRRG